MTNDKVITNQVFSSDNMHMQRLLDLFFFIDEYENYEEIIPYISLALTLYEKSLAISGVEGKVYKYSSDEGLTFSNEEDSEKKFIKELSKYKKLTFSKQDAAWFSNGRGQNDFSQKQQSGLKLLIILINIKALKDDLKKKDILIKLFFLLFIDEICNIINIDFSKKIFKDYINLFLDKDDVTSRELIEYIYGDEVGLQEKVFCDFTKYVYTNERSIAKYLVRHVDEESAYEIDIERLNHIDMLGTGKHINCSNNVVLPIYKKEQNIKEYNYLGYFAVLVHLSKKTLESSCKENIESLFMGLIGGGVKDSDDRALALLKH